MRFTPEILIAIGHALFSRRTFPDQKKFFFGYDKLGPAGFVFATTAEVAEHASRQGGYIKGFTGRRKGFEPVPGRPHERRAYERAIATVSIAVTVRDLFPRLLVIDKDAVTAREMWYQLCHATGSVGSSLLTEIGAHDIHV